MGLSPSVSDVETRRPGSDMRQASTIARIGEQAAIVFAEPPFQTELEESGYDDAKLWNAEAIYSWCKHQLVDDGIIAKDDNRLLILRQLADQFYMQGICRYYLHHNGPNAKLGRSSCFSLLERAQKNIRDMLKVFGVGNPVGGRNQGGAAQPKESLPDEDFT